MQNSTELESNFKRIRSLIPENVQLVAVSKTHPAEMIQSAYDLGQRVFGENKVQELLAKQPVLPRDIAWHLIGHLQTNKVKYIAGFIDTVQSVDSAKILHEINKQAEKHNRTIKVLLQIKIAAEDTKFGLHKDEAEILFQQYLAGDFPHVQITGLMGMATFTEDRETVKKEFSTLKNIFDEFSMHRQLQTLSMGMSDDFQLAIECGANSVRIGSALFGKRNYGTSF
ncbi:YggS family pyridoxal phosphate-dependent enzyme [Kaistella palustris]|uniref:YggS family pyridoxal phosphate-dependent enzyme n=1 Tax=Kaistella palustris TaxID=493376 RepID=UPI0004891A33|nr:YggS family pyridoxal phosphate-dependent enzyme [Kaistella palustris]